VTDYEISKRLAEIAGVEVDERPDWLGGPVMLLWHSSCGQSDFWSPLTDWSQLAPLVERFVFDVERHSAAQDSPWTVIAQRTPESPMVDASGPLDRAICLAIIAAHEGD
jgi:hypothetical protein